MSCDDDGVVSIGDVLESIEEENAIVMGGIDNERICSFTKGYMKRQAVYTCNTCLDISKVKAGFCYPCSINCHEGHDIVELYTKRKFRCDCGNAKFESSFKCQLWEEKDDYNSQNVYNQNFSNEYCTCHRPYPDEAYEGDENMMQCGICEDWFHTEHLNMGSQPVPDDHEELTCFLCMQKFAFIMLYAAKEPDYSNIFDSLSCNPEISNKRPKVVLNSDCRLVATASEFGFADLDVHHLSYEDLKITDTIKIPSIFWKSQWRTWVCSCIACIDMYKSLNIQFTLDPEDTMAFYLELGKLRSAELDNEASDALNKAMSEMPHPVAINVATAVSGLRNALAEFFQQKREENHIITAEEVKSFFEKLRKDNYNM